MNITDVAQLEKALGIKFTRNEGDFVSFEGDKYGLYVTSQSQNNDEDAVVMYSTYNHQILLDKPFSCMFEMIREIYSAYIVILDMEKERSFSKLGIWWKEF